MRSNIEKVLASIDPQLRYLMLLSERGIKPLSRWEGLFGRREEAAVDALGLAGRTIRRRLRGGDPIRELVFSRSPGYLELYAGRFEGEPLGHAPETQRLEGFLFGYPSCCVDSFIKHGYRENNLSPEDQQLLFHWACKGCRMTPGLLGEYRRIWRESERLSWKRPSRPAILRIGGGIAAAVVACVGLGCSTSPTDNDGVSLVDPHVIEVPEDKDRDGLSDQDELLLAQDYGFDFQLDRRDTDGDAALDGAEIAQRIVSAMGALDVVENETHAYKVEVLARGIEVCSVCGESVNMGEIRVIHAGRGLEVSVPFIAVHFMEFGSFSYTGSVHEGHVDVVRLGQALEVLPMNGGSSE